MSDDDFFEELRQRALAEERSKQRHRDNRAAAPPADAPTDAVASVEFSDEPMAFEELQDMLARTAERPGDGDTSFKTGIKELDDLIRHHAPREWQRQLAPERLRHLLETGDPVTMIVMSADIRKSTLIMRETLDYRQFARILSEFVTAAARFIRWGRGWFDKFTGDGLLAYWIVDNEDDFDDLLGSALQTAHHVLKIFNQRTLAQLKRNSRNFPAGVGMAAGLDAGQAHLVTVAHALTVVGHPVVGAVRMGDAAREPGHLVCNVRAGQPLYERRQRILPDMQFDVTRLMGSTKEYDAQETYLVEFLDLWED